MSAPITDATASLRGGSSGDMNSESGAEAIANAAAAEIELRSRRRRFAVMGRSASLKVGLGIFAFFGVVALVSFFWTPYPPLAPATGPFYSAPSLQHLFGTDATGGDVCSRALAATQTDVGITLAVVGLSLLIGTVWGSLAGFHGGWFDAASMRVLQVMNSFPSILLAMLVISVFGRGVLPLILVVALIPMPDYVRLARAEVMTKKNWQFAEAARMVGRRPMGVLFRHLVPNSTRPLLSYAGINASWVIATVGALGFIGLGIEPGSAEWGSMISGGQASIVDGRWWISFFPGMLIFLLAAGFHLIGDGLSEDELENRR
jgi:peptide/nickel transport system permease protein